MSEREKNQAEKVVTQTMKVVALFDTIPTSNPCDRDYDPMNDPTLNIQYTYDQKFKSVVVKKTPEDYARLAGLLFNEYYHSDYTMDDNPTNRAVVGFLWKSWGKDETNTLELSALASYLKFELGLPFEITWDQMEDLKKFAEKVKTNMMKAFLHIYRNYSAEK